MGDGVGVGETGVTTSWSSVVAVGVGEDFSVDGGVAPPLAVFGLGQAVLVTVLPAPTFVQLLIVGAALFVVLSGPAMRSATEQLLAVVGSLLTEFRRWRLVRR